MSSWQALAEEAARWHEAGRTAQLWWRDDDAADSGPALDRLLELHRQTKVPLSLAVVPALGTPALADRLAAEPGATRATAEEFEFARPSAAHQK